MLRASHKNGIPPPQGLYDPAQEHDACGIGFVASIRGEMLTDTLQFGRTSRHRRHAVIASSSTRNVSLLIRLDCSAMGTK